MPVGLAPHGQNIELLLKHAPKITRGCQDRVAASMRIKVKKPACDSSSEGWSFKRPGVLARKVAKGGLAAKDLTPKTK